MYRTRTNFASPAAADTGIHLLCSATARAKLSEFIISSDASPVEQSGEYQIGRTTTAGTTAGATLTVQSSDPLSPTASVTAEGDGYATEPTVGDIMMDVAVHQKATFRWVAYPGREIQSVASANNGIGLIVIGQSAAFSLNLSVEWSE
jgi:hypothetical protein